MVGVPTLQYLKMKIRQKIIHNCLVTFEDIEVAEKICGHDVSILKGITMRQIPKVFMYDCIEISIELINNSQELILCVEIMFINENTFTTKINKYIRFKDYSHLKIKQDNKINQYLPLNKLNLTVSLNKL